MRRRPARDRSVRASAPYRLGAAIVLVSAAALALQLLLMRWLAIAHWHPFAVVIISLALLGHGASGSALVLWRRAALRHFDWLFPACAIGFALAVVASVLLAARIPFNGLELVWDWRQLGWLSALYLVLALPFFFAASCFGLAFARHGADIPSLYGADLAGAGLGAGLALALLHLPTGSALAVACALALSGAMLAVRGRHAPWLLPAAGAVLVAMALPGTRQALAPTVNSFKGQAKVLLLPGARVLAERRGVHGVVAAVRSPQVPLRHVPGLSLGNTQEPPPQLALFTDGDAMRVVTRRTADTEALAYLARTTSALPYRLLQRPRVLVLGGGGGADALQALALGARAVDVIEPDPNVAALVQGPFDAFAGGLYRDPRVRVHVDDLRGFLHAQRPDRAPGYELIVLAQGGSFAAGGAGVQAVAEDYAATVEALRAARARLAPGGLLAVTRWHKQPPRDWLKLFATAVEALRAEGVRDPGRQLAAIGNWDAGTLLIRRGPFARADIVRLQVFADAQGFDVVHAPGLQPRAADNFHAGASAAAQAGARALLSPRRDAFIERYKFDIVPATDDRPYFGNFFRWATLPELWRLRGQGAAVLLDSGYLLLLAALLLALPLALALVLLPLLALPRDTGAGMRRWRAAAWFLCLGLAFLMIEIACLARLKLLLGQPLPAIGVGLAGFLLFAGLGSLWVQGLPLRDSRALVRWQARSVLLIGAGLLWHALAFAVALRLGAAAAAPVRAGLALLSIAPLAFAMGLPFALGLSRLAREAPAFVPWAWGINGCASVVAAIAALLLAIEAGLVATLLLAFALYVLGAWAWRQEAEAPAPAHPAAA